MSDRLERFFDKASGKIDLVKNVRGKVGGGPLNPVGKSFAVKEVRIADLPVEIGGRLEANAQIHGLDEAVTIHEFDHPDGVPRRLPIVSLPILPGSESRPEKAKPPTGTAFSELVIFIGADASATFKPPAIQALTISAGASASGSMRYRLLLPAAGSATRVAAIGKLLESARPPQLLDLPGIRPGEHHSFDARFQLGFDLSADVGRRFDFSTEIDLFDGVSPTLSAHAEATLNASLGWSLYDRLQMSVGKLNVGEVGDDWVRVRLQRLNRRELTLGAKLAVQIDYDLGRETFAALLDRILQIEPYERLVDRLDEVESTGIHKITTEADWIAVRDTFSTRLGELVLEYVDVDSVIGKLPFDKVEPFLHDIEVFIRKYRELDRKIQSLVGSITGRVDLGVGSSFREAIDEIAALDPTDLDAVFDRVSSPEFDKAIDLLELLSGSSVEELLIGTRAAEAIEEAALLAAQARDFLDGLGPDAVARLHSFVGRTGIDGVMAWLVENATSTAKLKTGIEKRATKTILDLVERLTDTAWNTLDQHDLKKIKGLAEALVELNDRRREIEEKLADAVEALKGEAGFSVGIEIGRLTERASILDLEIDSSVRKIRRATEEALAGLEARVLLDKLAEKSDGADDPSYRLRDSIFSHRRVRSGAFANFFSILGIKRGRRTVRVDEEVVRVVKQAGAQRRATYSTGTIRRISDGSKDALAGSHELGVWLTLRLTGSGTNLDAKYNHETGRGLRVVYSRADNKTLPGELGALGQLMADLGFAGVDGEPVGSEIAPPESAIQTEFSFAVELGAAAVDAVMKNKTRAPWRTDYRNASHRWFDDDLVPFMDRDASGSPRVRKGRLLAGVIAHRNFDPAFSHSSTFLRTLPMDRWNVVIGDTTYRVPLLSRPKQGRYIVLNRLLASVGPATAKLGDTVDRYKKAKSDLRPEDLRVFGKTFATLLKRTPFKSWPSPMFNLWLILARIARQDPDALDEARGLATLRFRADSDSPWQERRWKLKGAHRGSNIFPF